MAIPSRYSIVKTLEKKHESSKAAVKSAMASVEFVATTADCWTAHRRCYLGVTVHWLCYDNFKRKIAALACRRLTGSHTYDLLADQLQDMYCKYGIKIKVIKTTTDSISNFVKAFSALAPSENDLGVCAIDASDILSTDLNSQLPPHHKCAAHLLNFICATDAAVAEQNHQYKKVSRGTFAKCQALWNKTNRSVLAAEVVENESSLQTKRPSSTPWNSVYDAVRRLNKIIEPHIKGSQALCNICQRLDLPRYVAVCCSYRLYYSYGYHCSVCSGIS